MDCARAVLRVAQCGACSGCATCLLRSGVERCRASGALPVFFCCRKSQIVSITCAKIVRTADAMQRAEH
jgi:hypothetical protein